jgi:thiamine biosynthesis lipoprotein
MEFVSDWGPRSLYCRVIGWTRLIAIGARSASVIGPDGALCDALATALMVEGIDAQKWIGRAKLAEFSFWTINRHDGTAWA